MLLLRGERSIKDEFGISFLEKDSSNLLMCSTIGIYRRRSVKTGRNLLDPYDPIIQTKQINIHFHTVLHPKFYFCNCIWQPYRFEILFDNCLS